MTGSRTLWLGLRVAIVVGCLAFLFVQAREVGQQMSLVDWLPASGFWYAAAAAPIFAATAWGLAWCWQILLRGLGHSQPYLPLARTLFLTQVGKYVPGNVGHHVGRVALARRQFAIPVSTSISSLLQESALLCLSALATALACALALPDALPALSFRGWRIDILPLLAIIIATGLGALAVVNALSGSPQWPRSKPIRWLATATPAWRQAAGTTPIYVGVFLLNGMALLLLALPLLESTQHVFLPLTAAFALSWVIGFVVPGAPGGLGVREAALIFLLDGVLAKETVLAIALMSRLSMTLADALIFLLGLSLPGRPPQWTTPE